MEINSTNFGMFQLCHSHQSAGSQHGSMAMQQEAMKIGGTCHVLQAYVLGQIAGNIPRKYGLKYGTDVPPSVGS